MRIQSSLILQVKALILWMSWFQDTNCNTTCAFQPISSRPITFSTINSPQKAFLRESIILANAMHNSREIEKESDSRGKEQDKARRQFFIHSVTGLSTAFPWHKMQAQARGLVQFPLPEYKPLMNTYHFMRAGESLLEEENILYTNPLFLTNRENALSDTGRLQIQQGAAKILNNPQTIPSILKYSLAANCIDTADLLKTELGIGESRLVSEFVFLDPRAAGKWDSLPLQSTEEALWALDVEFAGLDGTSLDDRPPPNDDGTPHETLGDSVTRLRQLLSGLETQYSGETILLIFPDGTGPALLMCCMAGIPLNRVHELQFMPGQIQLNVTRTTATQLLRQQEEEQAAALASGSVETTTRQEYLKRLNRGKKELERLRSLDPREIVNVREEQYAIAQEIERKRLADQTAQNKLLELRRLEQQQQQKSVISQSVEYVSSKGPDGQDNLLPTLAGGAALVVAGIAALTSGRKDQVTEAQSPSGKDTSPNRSLTMQSDSTAEDTLTISQQTESDSKVLSFNTESNPILPLETTQDSDSLLNEGSPQFSPLLPLKKETETKSRPTAQQVMEDYLNKDDGQEAWLSFLEEEIKLADKLEDEQLGDLFEGTQVNGAKTNTDV